MKENIQDLQEQNEPDNPNKLRLNLNKINIMTWNCSCFVVRRYIYGTWGDFLIGN
jgi:hypothetical protein